MASVFSVAGCQKKTQPIVKESYVPEETCPYPIKHYHPTLSNSNFKDVDAEDEYGKSNDRAKVLYYACEYIIAVRLCFGNDYVSGVSNVNRTATVEDC